MSAGFAESVSSSAIARTEHVKSIGRGIGAVFGVGFALLLVASVWVVNIPRDVDDAEMLAWWSKTANQTSILVSAILMVAAGIMLIGLLTEIRIRTGSAFASFAYLTGCAAAAIMIVSRAGMEGIAAALRRDDEALPGVDLLRFLPQVSYASMGIALATVGVSLVIFGLGNRTSNALPGWWAWVSVILGIILAVGGLPIGPFLIPVLVIWALATSVALWRNPFN